MKLRLEKRLILIRHAHRDTIPREANNGLSETGQKQARKILAHFQDQVPASTLPTLMSSPKQRCIETLEPIAAERKLKIEVSDWLDEGPYLEERVENFIRWWKAKGPELTVLCSHGDWLPICIESLTGERVDIDKGGWAELTFSLRNGP